MTQQFKTKLSVKFLLTITYFLLCFLLHAQTPDLPAEFYVKQWHDIDSLLLTEETQKAEDILMQLQDLAKKEKNTAQIVKTFLFKIVQTPNIKNTEGGYIALRALHEATNAAEYPEKPILQSMLGEIYIQFLRENNYHKPLKDSILPKNDVRLMTSEEILILAKKLLVASCHDLRTQKLNVNILDALTKPNWLASDTIRPTVFDFLAHRVFSVLEKIPYNLEINNYYGSVSKNTLRFMSLKEEIIDSLNTNDIKINLIEKLITFHKNDANKMALIETELLKIKFDRTYQQRYSNNPYLYVETLEKLFDTYKNTPEVLPIVIKLVKKYEELGENYYQGHNEIYRDTSMRYMFKKAMALCEDYARLYPASFYKTELENYKKRLNRHDFNVKIDAVNTPNMPMLAQLTYRNIDKLYGYWLPIISSSSCSFPIRDSLEWASMQKQIVAGRSFSQVLPHFDDFQPHTTEIILDSMPVGRYILLLSPKPDFEMFFTNSFNNTEGYFIQQIDVTISNISVFKIPEQGDFVIVNRTTGLPIQNAKMNANNTVFTSNKNGIIQQVNAHKAVFSYQKDTILWSNYENNQYSTEKEETFVRIHFFTDRNIYRPAQKIYFKGILVKENAKNAEKRTVWAKQRVKIGLFKGDDYISDLYDFEEALDTLLLTSNEFGSFAGNFIAPSNGNLGDFQIVAFPYLDDEKELEDWDDNFEVLTNEIKTKIKIEEYKRPRFDAYFEPIAQSFKYGDSITLKGIVRSFAGSNNDGAKVVYTVSRQLIDSYATENVADSIIFTDLKGNFEIHFPTDLGNENDASLDEQKYIFRVKATVTDLNGETHDAEQTVYVGSSAITINFLSPKYIDRKTTTSIPLSINMPNDAFVSGQGALKVELLHSPIYKKMRYKKMLIDTFMYDSVQFHQKLPKYSFRSVLTNKNEEPIVLKTTHFESKYFDTSVIKNGLILPNIKNWAIGTYRISVHVFDKDLGDTIRKSVIFQVVDYAKNAVPPTIDLLVYTDKNNFSKKQKIPIHIHSPFDTSSVFIEFLDNKKVIQSAWIYSFSAHFVYFFDAKQVIYENISYRVTIVKDNRLFCKVGKILFINDKNLNVQFASFRNHLAPGQNETWTIHITDGTGKPVSAELAATLYDAALDNLTNHTPHNWFDWMYSRKNTSYVSTVTEIDFDGVSSHKIINKMNTAIEKWTTIQLIPRTWLWFSTFYDLEETDMSLLKYLTNSNSKTENSNEILRGIFYKDGKRYMSILMQIKTDSSGVLKPVIIIGHNTMKKKDLTGAISTITSKDMTIISQGELINALQGKIAGVSFTAPKEQFAPMPPKDFSLSSLSEVVVTGYSTTKKPSPKSAFQDANGVKTPDLTQIKIRKNLNETVFFMPQLKTDVKGNVQLNFTMNEALTRWKFLSFAHTQKLQSGILENTVVTQKDLMVFPNMPRFLREGDEIELVTKISNLKTNEILRGSAILNLFDAATEKSVDSLFLVSKSIVEWSAKGGESAVLKWKIKVTTQEIPALMWRIAAKSGNFSDGEQNVLPILPKQILVTQTLPLSIAGEKTDTFHFRQFDNLINMNTGNTLRHHRFNMNIVANPAWNLVTSLAYSMAYPHECSEQLFSRFYSNALAASIFEKMPQLKAFLNQNREKKANLSEITPELQQTLMEEAPQLIETNGIFDGQKLSKLFDLNRMAQEQKKDFDKLATRITPEGGLAWYPDGSASWFISQHIAAGLGHLAALGVQLPKNEETKTWLNNLVLFTDAQLVNYYEKMLKTEKKTLDYAWYNERNLAIQHVYMRSFYNQIPFDTITKRCIDSTLKYIEKHWENMNLYQKTLGALATNRLGKKETAQKIVAFLKKTAQIDISGMHWGQLQGIYWYEMPVETQALLIEAFNEISQDSASVFLIKKHLLTEMDNHGRWTSTKATTEAIYALLLVGDKTPNQVNKIKINSLNKVLSEQFALSVQSDKGFIETSVKGVDIDKNLAKTVVSNQNKTDITGSISWQFYENIDKVKAFNNVDSVVVLTKKIYKLNSMNEEQMLLIADTSIGNEAASMIRVGDKLRIKLTIKADKPLEYVHLKDMRPANCEPVDVVSQRQWNCYKTTRDVSTNFFFDYIPVGEHVLTYDVTVQQRGDFASGVASLQCMYVPSVTAYTEGGRLRVD